MPETGANAASPSNGSSPSWRVERTVLNIAGHPPVEGGFCRKGLLVLLYPTEWPLRRVSSVRGVTRLRAVFACA
jgi:hypothetical protein